MSDIHGKGFVSYRNIDSDRVVLALELTRISVLLMKGVPELSSLASKCKPGDFVIAFEEPLTAIPREDFLKSYVLVK